MAIRDHLRVQVDRTRRPLPRGLVITGLVIACWGVIFVLWFTVRALAAAM